MRSRLLCAAVAAIPFAFISTSFAALPTAYTLQEQVRANLLANPSGSFNVPHGSTFGSTTVSLNNLGEVASKISTVGNTTDQGIFYGPGNGTGSVVAQQNSDTVGFLSDVNIGDTGRIIVSQSQSASGIADGFYYRDRGQAAGTTYLTGASGLSASGYRVLPNNNVLSRTSLNNVVGHRSYNASTTSVQTYVTQTVGGYSFLGSAAPADDGRIASRVFNDTQPSTSNDQVRLFAADGTSTLIATEGGTVPGMSGTIASFQNPMTANKNGFVAFIANVGGKSSVLVSDGTTTHLVANADSPLVSAIDVFAPSVNSAGRVAFRGKEEDGDDAIFVGDGLGNLVRVMGEGDVVASDFGPAVFGQETTSSPTLSGAVVLNDNNQVAFTAGLYPVGQRNVELGTAIYIANAAVPEPATLCAVAGIGAMLIRRRR